MQLGRVLGSVVATEKTPGLEGIRFLIVQPLDKQSRAKGETLVAAGAPSRSGPGQLA